MIEELGKYEMSRFARLSICNYFPHTLSHIHTNIHRQTKKKKEERRSKKIKQTKGDFSNFKEFKYHTLNQNFSCLQICQQLSTIHVFM